MLLRNLYEDGKTIIRVLAENEEKYFIIDCLKRTMPFWVHKDVLREYHNVDEQTLHERMGVWPIEEESLSRNAIALAHKRYSIIAPAVAVVADKKRRTEMIAFAASNSGVSKQTVRKYLCLYLVHQTVSILAPIDSTNEAYLTKEQKWMRWALNKFFYTCRQKGLTNYQRNYRPLLGEGTSGYAQNVGVAMLDSTICDIYLVDEVGNLLGRPILTACVDAYSQLCCGFALTWEGGMKSLRKLMQNVITDKVEHCKQHGILISNEEWNCDQLPGVLMTDRGMEYCSENFEQLSELGVTIVNLPSYRPELKGIVEKFFDIVQNYYKPYLKGKGVIEPDYQQRGAHDYRLDACMTLEDFKKIMLRCIVHYNSKRKLASVSYTSDMLDNKVKPYPNSIFTYGKTLPGANLISVGSEKLRMTLMPRTTGTFSRKGLSANGLRYKCEGFTERFLKGGACVVAFNPNNVSCVWLFENSKYIKFDLIESRYKNKSLLEVENIKTKIKELKSVDESQTIQAEIDLQKHISVIGDAAKMMRLKSTGDASDV